MHTSQEMMTLSDDALIPNASQFTEQDGITACTEPSRCKSSCCIEVTQLMTDHCGILQVPAIIAHSPPGAIVVDLHTPLMWTRPSHQSNTWVSILQAQQYNDSIQHHMYRKLPNRYSHINYV